MPPLLDIDLEQVAHVVERGRGRAEMALLLDRRRLGVALAPGILTDSTLAGGCRVPGRSGGGAGSRQYRLGRSRPDRDQR